MTPSNIRKFTGLKLQEEDTTSGICMGIYGTGGGGKTSLLADIVRSPHGTPAALFDAEGGSKSVEHLKPLGLHVYPITSWADVMRARQQIKRGDHDYKSFIWDNVSEISTLCMQDINPGANPPQIQHWGIMTARMLEFIREFRDMSRLGGLNSLFCLWEEWEKDELSGTIRKKVNLTPKFGAAFPGIVTMVGRLTVPGKARDNYIRKLSFAPSEDTDAKFRVTPTEAAAKIPLELYLKQDSHFLADFLATVKDGVEFPIAKYAAPARAVNG